MFIQSLHKNERLANNTAKCTQNKTKIQENQIQLQLVQLAKKMFAWKCTVEVFSHQIKAIKTKAVGARAGSNDGDIETVRYKMVPWLLNYLLIRIHDVCQWSTLIGNMHSK